MWLLAVGRALYAAGVAVQAAAGSIDPAATTTAAATQATMSELVLPTELPHLWIRYLNAANSRVGPASMLEIFKRALLNLKPVFSTAFASNDPLTAASEALGKQLQMVLSEAHVSQLLSTFDNLLECLNAVGTRAKGLPAQLEAAAAAAEGDGAKFQWTEGSCVQAWQQLLDTPEGRQLPALLISFGSMLCAALPNRYCCNEPSCCCLDKPSELQLASSKGSQCSGCGVVRYCGAAHQKQHWKQHKAACRAIAAAAKAHR